MAEEDKHTCSQLCTHWRSQCPISDDFPRTNSQRRTTNIQKYEILMQCRSRKPEDCHFIHLAVLRIFFLKNTMPSKAFKTVVKFQKRIRRQKFYSIQDDCRSQKLHVRGFF